MTLPFNMSGELGQYTMKSDTNIEDYVGTRSNQLDDSDEHDVMTMLFQHNVAAVPYFNISLNDNSSGEANFAPGHQDYLIPPSQWHEWGISLCSIDDGCVTIENDDPLSADAGDFLQVDMDVLHLKADGEFSHSGAAINVTLAQYDPDSGDDFNSVFGS